MNIETATQTVLRELYDYFVMGGGAPSDSSAIQYADAFAQSVREASSLGKVTALKCPKCKEGATFRVHIDELLDPPLSIWCSACNTFIGDFWRLPLSADSTGEIGKVTAEMVAKAIRAHRPIQESAHAVWQAIANDINKFVAEKS